MVSGKIQVIFKNFQESNYLHCKNYIGRVSQIHKGLILDIITKSNAIKTNFCRSLYQSPLAIFTSNHHCDWHPKF